MPPFRRDLLIALAALPFAAAQRGIGEASSIDPAQTSITLPSEFSWTTSEKAPAKSVESTNLYGNPDKPGPYLQVVRWYPGFMSAPHRYDTDRLCVVLSGVWWCNSGSEFDPSNAVPAAEGSFVHRYAKTWHFDGVRRESRLPATIAIYGIGPVNVEWFNGSSIMHRI